MKLPVKLTIPSDPKYLCTIRKVLQDLMCCHEVPEETACRLVLCVDEACSNIIKYSYEGKKDQPIDISFIIEDDIFEVKIRDYGNPCDEKKINPRSLNKIKPGGLGTHFIYEIMDKVDYCTDCEKGTILTMCKKLTGDTGSVQERKKER